MCEVSSKLYTYIISFSHYHYMPFVDGIYTYAYTYIASSLWVNCFQTLKHSLPFIMGGLIEDVHKVTSRS